MSHDPALIRELVGEMIEFGRSPEEVCRDRPELLEAVRLHARRVRAVEGQLDAMFPSPVAGNDAGAAPDESLPRIPGYEVLGVVGQGGMGVVYLARHVSLNRTVAIKVPLAGAFATPAERQRHMREAQAIAALGHENIITVHEVGESEGRPYFTMEFIGGGHLGARLSNTPQPAREAALLVATLAGAMQRAHEAGIVHRDLKPANVLMTPEGTPKITDFGLARRSDANATLTMGGLQFGTPSYMAPEQAGGRIEAQGASVDIYSLGAILYEALTGRPPFRGESTGETLRQVLEDEPAVPSRLNPRVPRDLENICLMCLRKEARRRYASAGALALDLGRFLRGEPVEARRSGKAERVYRWVRRHPARATLVGAGACACVAAIAAGLWIRHIADARAAEASVREARARQAIETAVLLAAELRTNGRWIEAGHVLDDAQGYVAEANSSDLALDLDEADTFLAAARELDEIRGRYPESSEIGFDYRPAVEAYRGVFERLGLGEGVRLEDAAAVVNSSPIRGELLIALDNAAFVARAMNHREGLERALAVARTADPDPWRDRFRQPASWLDRERLLALYQDAMAGPDAPAPHQVVIIGVLLSGLGANDQAIAILRGAQEREPVDFWVNLELGNALARAGRFDDATQYFRAAATIQPGGVGAWMSLAINLGRAGLGDEAILAARRAAEINPGLVWAWQILIEYLRAAGRLGEAQAALDRAIAANPDDRASFDDVSTDLLLDRARHHASLGQWQLALSDYRAGLLKGTGDAEFWFEAAAVCLIADEPGQYEVARDSMLSWSSPETLRTFLVARTVTLAPSPVGLVEAARALSDAELRRESSTFWAPRQQGAILCRLGRYEEAIPLLERGASTPSTGRAVLSWLWLAIAHHHAGDDEEARRWSGRATGWFDTLSTGMPANAGPLGLHLHDWLEALVLRAELDRLFSGAAPNGGGATP